MQAMQGFHACDVRAEAVKRCKVVAVIVVRTVELRWCERYVLREGGVHAGAATAAGKESGDGVAICKHGVVFEKRALSNNAELIACG